MRYWLLTILAALATALLLAFLQGARAQETQSGLICDTQDETIAVMQSDDTKEAVAIIDNSIPDACAFATVHFYRGKFSKLVKSDGATYEITPIYVLAIEVNGVMTEAHDANIQWSAFKSNLIEVTDLDGQWANSPNSAWYEKQRLTPQTKKEYHAAFDSCCDMGDVCQQCVVHHFSNKPPWADGWYYEKDGVLKQLPPHIVDYVDWTPTGKPVLFLYPYDGGVVPKGTPTCLKVPGGSS